VEHNAWLLLAVRFSENEPSFDEEWGSLALGCDLQVALHDIPQVWIAAKLGRVLIA
jgi:hypothetical protein